MSAIQSFIKREPALIAMLVAIISTLAASIPTGQGVLGGVVSGIIAVVVGALRQVVSSPATVAAIEAGTASPSPAAPVGTAPLAR